MTDLVVVIPPAAQPAAVSAVVSSLPSLLYRQGAMTAVCSLQGGPRPGCSICCSNRSTGANNLNLAYQVINSGYSSLVVSVSSVECNHVVSTIVTPIKQRHQHSLAAAHNITENIDWEPSVSSLQYFIPQWVLTAPHCI